jgi:hypothetical protein
VDGRLVRHRADRRRDRPCPRHEHERAGRAPAAVRPWPAGTRAGSARRDDPRAAAQERRRRRHGHRRGTAPVLRADRRHRYPAVDGRRGDPAHRDGHWRRAAVPGHSRQCRERAQQHPGHPAPRRQPRGAAEGSPDHRPGQRRRRGAARAAPCGNRRLPVDGHRARDLGRRPRARRAQLAAADPDVLGPASPQGPRAAQDPRVHPAPAVRHRGMAVHRRDHGRRHRGRPAGHLARPRAVGPVRRADQRRAAADGPGADRRAHRGRRAGHRQPGGPAARLGGGPHPRGRAAARRVTGLRTVRSGRPRPTRR